MVFLSITEIAIILNKTIRSTKRLIITLNFTIIKPSVLSFADDHPFIRSLIMASNLKNKLPLYTVSQLKTYWLNSSSNPYSSDNIRRLLKKNSITIYNKGKGRKGYIYLIDLVKLTTKPPKSNQTNEE